MKRKGSEIEESFFYGFEETQEADESQSKFLGTFIEIKRLHILAVVVLVGFSMIIGKSVYLQIIEGNHYYNKAEGNRAKVEYLTAHRGLIYDSELRPLVANEPLFDISLVPGNLPLEYEERGKRVEQIAEFLELDPVQLTEQISTYSMLLKQPITIKENVSYDDALRHKIGLGVFPSLSLEIRNQRKYVDPAGFSHLLGYVGKINEEEYSKRKGSDYLFNDYIGKSGLEKQYESVLRGEYGKREIEVDAGGRQQKVIYEKESVNGSSIILSIDQELQDQIYKISEQYLREIGKNRAAVVLIDPRDGAIRAAVSYPTYNNNFFAQGISQAQYSKYVEDPTNPLFDRIIRGTYPAGSTIKLIVGAAAIEEKVITETTSFLSTGGITVADLWFFPDWRPGGHGYTNIYKAIADSVNTFFYIVGGGYKEFNGLGLDRLVEYYHRFGLGQKTGIDLPGESLGLVPTREWKTDVKGEEWYIGDTYHMAIGQGDVLVTPLQVAQYTAAFANGGKIFRPHLVQSIIDHDGIASEYEAELISKDFVDPYTIRVIQRGMRQAVTDGSAVALSTLPVQVAGKTGTAQFSTVKEPHAWFAGYAPYDKPELVITVLIEEGEEGSRTAVGLARRILNYIYTQ